MDLGTQIALIGDAEHPPHAYIAQGRDHGGSGAPSPSNGRESCDWKTALAGYQAVSTMHCRRVVTGVPDWGTLLQLDGGKSERAATNFPRPRPARISSSTGSQSQAPSPPAEEPPSSR